MKSKLILAGLVIILCVVCGSCNPEAPSGPGGSNNAPPGPTTAAVTGFVTDSRNQAAIGNAVVNLVQLAKGIDVIDSTDGNGQYFLSVDLGDTLATTGNLTITKGGFRQKILAVVLTPGGTTQQDIPIVRDTTTPPGGGGGGTTYANTIAFIGATSSQLAVYGVGGTETAIITYEVRDSLGAPVDINHSDTVFFSLIPAGFGGAYISPTRAVTNASGRVAITVNSGTIAGTIQIRAQVTRRGGGTPITSQPVRIEIFGGLPDQPHFSIGANPINVGGLDVILVTSQVTALVGDIYANPVAIGTAVYFTTSEGIITTNTGFTNVNGSATVTLFSGNPISVNGFGTLTANTLGAGGTNITINMPILFSGGPQIDSVAVVGGGPLTVDAATQKTVAFTVRDRNLNPVVGGTFISASIGGASALVSDVAPSGIVPDTQSPFWTRFSVVVSKDVQAQPPVNGAFTLTLGVSGSSGSANRSVGGTVQ